MDIRPKTSRLISRHLTPTGYQASRLSLIRMVPFRFEPSAAYMELTQRGLLVNGILGTALTQINQKSLTTQGLLHAGLLGVGLWTFLGAAGWSVCVTYLVLGSLVTKVRMKEKERLGIAEKRGGARGPENVWGSAATAMVCALMTCIFPASTPALKVAYTASLSTKLADTFQSEIGKAYGKTTYLITNFKRVPKGTEGAVSLEGTVAGIIGSILLSLFAFKVNLISSAKDGMVCIISAFFATFVESYIGATLQTKDNQDLISNELVNLINTMIGAGIALFLFRFS